MRRRGGALSASPVLVGAVTVLVTLVAVVISYSANEGLPFVPTYRIKAEVPNAAKLVEGNDVRAGGFRIGQVTKIRGARRRVDGEVRAIAELELELDKKVEPLPVDTTVRIRPRSALGLKYVDLVPGRSPRTYLAGDTIPLRRGDTAPEDLEDVLSTFQPETRVDARQALQGFGNGLAGRGPALNRTIEELRPFLTRLEPVMRALSARPTELRGLFPALGPDAPAGRPGGRRPGRVDRGHGRHVRGHRQESEGSPGDHRGERPDARRRDRVVPGPDALPRALRGPVASPAAGRGGAAAGAAAA